jgi:uncharacterized protein (TIGR00369 family)
LNYKPWPPRILSPGIPIFANRVLEIWERANFIKDLGMKLESFEPGRVVTSLEIKQRHLPEQIHPCGSHATLADHSAGGAGGTLLAPDEVILTIEYKINFLRPAIGESLRCTAEVFQHGKTIIVAQSDVFAIKSGREKLAARATVTLGVVSSRISVMFEAGSLMKK